MDEPRINQQIRAPKIKLISDDGTQVGDIDVRDAIKMAEEQGLDLVEVAPKARPPVCRIMDYGKYKYRMKKKTHKATHTVQLKEIKFRPTTEKHDYDYKLEHARKFLGKGDKVKMTVFFRGREMAHKELGNRIIEQIKVDLADAVKVEQDVKMQGRFMSMVVAPVAKAAKAAHEPKEEN